GSKWSPRRTSGTTATGRSTARSRSGRPSSRAVGEAEDEPHSLPVVVDRAALVVDEAGVEPDLLHCLEAEIGLELGRALRPRYPEPIGGAERVSQRPEAALQLRAARGEQDEDLGAGLGAELARERRGRVVLQRAAI